MRRALWSDSMPRHRFTELHFTAGCCRANPITPVTAASSERGQVRTAAAGRWLRRAGDFRGRPAVGSAVGAARRRVQRLCWLVKAGSHRRQPQECHSNCRHVQRPAGTGQSQHRECQDVLHGLCALPEGEEGGETGETGVRFRLGYCKSCVNTRNANSDLISSVSREKIKVHMLVLMSEYSMSNCIILT